MTETLRRTPGNSMTDTPEEWGLLQVVTVLAAAVAILASIASGIAWYLRNGIRLRATCQPVYSIIGRHSFAVCRVNIANRGRGVVITRCWLGRAAAFCYPVAEFAEKTLDTGRGFAVDFSLADLLLGYERIYLLNARSPVPYVWVETAAYRKKKIRLRGFDSIRRDLLELEEERRSSNLEYVAPARFFDGDWHPSFFASRENIAADREDAERLLRDRERPIEERLRGLGGRNMPSGGNKND